MAFTSATWPLGMLAPPPSAIGVAAKQVAVAAEHGAAPATSPLSYRQLNANHGPRFHGWYCRCVVWLNSSSWSMRKTSFPTGMMGNPATCGRKKRAATPDITTNGRIDLVSHGNDGQSGYLRQKEARGHAGHHHKCGQSVEIRYADANCIAGNLGPAPLDWEIDRRGANDRSE